MSGALGGLTSLISRGGQAFAGAQTIAAGLGGLLGFGSTGPVALGPFVFADFEVPAEIDHGGAQAHTVHKLPGGGRVIDVMGRDDKPVEWSGVFLGPNASTRATQLDALRIAGKPLPLTFGSYNLRVVIVSLGLKTKQINAHVLYQIACEVLSINPTASAPVSLLGSLSASIGQAVGVTQAGIAQLQQTAVGATQVAGALGLRAPFLNALNNDLALASETVGAVGSIAAAVPPAVSGAIAVTQGIAGQGQAASAGALAWFNGSAPTNATAAVAAVTLAGGAVSTQADTAAVAAATGQALATAGVPPPGSASPVVVPGGSGALAALNYLQAHGGVPAGAFTVVTANGISTLTMQGAGTP